MRVRVDIGEQVLSVFGADGACIRRYPVSTAANGAGEESGSYCTPHNQHHIHTQINTNTPYNTIFHSRRPTGEVWSAQFAAAHPGKDWVLTRILWLCGEELGRNRGGHVDSMRRYIYIHGTGDDQPMGVPLSHGCVRMRNRDIMELFDLVRVGTKVEICE